MNAQEIQYSLNGYSKSLFFSLDLEKEYNQILIHIKEYPMTKYQHFDYILYCDLTFPEPYIKLYSSRSLQVGSPSIFLKEHNQSILYVLLLCTINFLVSTIDRLFFLNVKTANQVLPMQLFVSQFVQKTICLS